MNQFELFEDEVTAPRGLRYAAEFISRDTEEQLISLMANLPMQRFQFGAFEGNRRVTWFGFRYDYTAQKLQETEPIPDWLTEISHPVERFGGLPSGSVRQVLCTEYDIGVGIGWHRDKPHFDQIFGLSLAAACKFRFRRRAGEKWERYTLQAQPRSLYGMQGESRHIWEHSIPPVEQRRYSITFRTMKSKGSSPRY